MTQRICKLLAAAAAVVLLQSCSAIDKRTGANSTGSGSSIESSAVSSDDSADPAAPEGGGIGTSTASAGEILDYFAEIAFGSEYGDSSDKLCRWENEILYTVTGAPTKADLELISIIVDSLNSINGFPGMREAGTLEDANFEIMFVTRDKIVELFDDADMSCTGMSEYRWYTESCEIFEARAAIDCEEEAERNSTICEEILQSMGLAMDSYAHPDSVFYQGPCYYSRPSKLDYAVLKLLYSPKLEAGMSRYESIIAAAGELRW